MALTNEEVESLDCRAREVGQQLGRELSFAVAPNPEYVGLLAGSIFVLGPTKVTELTALDMDLELDALESGQRKIIEDEDGDPRLI